MALLARGDRAGDPFDLALSAEGIEIRRPGQAPRQMSWDRVSAWELEERAGNVVLTLRADGAATPLLITGWDAGDLEALLRAVSGGPVGAPEAEDESAKAPGAESPRRTRRRRRVSAKALVTVVVLVVLATAVTLVLLQSAGVIDWGFLGPTA